MEDSEYIDIPEIQPKIGVNSFDNIPNVIDSEFVPRREIVTYDLAKYIQDEDIGKKIK